MGIIDRIQTPNAMSTITINPNNTVTLPLSVWHALTFQKRYRRALRHIEAIAEGKRDYVPFVQILEEAYPNQLDSNNSQAFLRS